VFDNGEKPYKDMANDVVIARVSRGYRLPRLPGCPEALYAIMSRCWSVNPEDRAGFDSLVKQLAAQRSQLDGAGSNDLQAGSRLGSLQGSSASSLALGVAAAHEYEYQQLAVKAISDPAGVRGDGRAADWTGAPPAVAPRPNEYVCAAGLTEAGVVGARMHDGVATLARCVEGFMEASEAEHKPMVAETNVDGEYLEVIGEEIEV